MSRTAATLMYARQVAQQYRVMAAAIDSEAADRKLSSMPLTRRILRTYAIIARRAAVAEELDPEPK